MASVAQVDADPGSILKSTAGRAVEKRMELAAPEVGVCEENEIGGNLFRSGGESMQRFHHFALRIWFVQEAGATILRQHGGEPARHQQHGHRRPMLADMLRKREPVHRARHFDVGKDRIDAAARFEDRDGLGGA